MYIYVNFVYMYYIYIIYIYTSFRRLVFVWKVSNIFFNSPSQNVETQCPRPPRCIPAKRHPRSKHRKFTFRETIPFTSLIITLSAQGPRCCCSWFLFEEELGSWNSRRIPYWNLTPGLCGCSDVSRKSSGCKHTYSQWKSVS